jgi:selenocysteine-specific elongation factor
LKPARAVNTHGSFSGLQIMRHFILGTAGHVDHGKTELVKALTGKDTDRLKEEKMRGISIELGYAPLTLDDETFIGIIDAPGHERFVKKMVAGSVGIDIAMLLVSADEGVMPQTKEHMEVLTSLSIPRGLVVISKMDLAGEEMKIILQDEIAELVEGTFLEGAHVVGTSAKTGQGIDELLGILKKLTDQLEERSSGGPFRLPVDRVFHRKGIGVVITGSCYSGLVRVGDSLELHPSGKRVRVRELQSFNTKKNEGAAGERLAIALQGVKLNELSRGDMLTTPSSFTATSMMDANLRLGSYASFELKNRERVRIHHGAKEVLGRVVLLDRDRLRSGEEAFVQLHLEIPLVPARGDHFVVRKYSPARVIGGGEILQVDAAKHKRFDAVVLEDLEAQLRGSPGGNLLRNIAAAGLKGLEADKLDRALLDELLSAGDVVMLEGLVFHRQVLESLADAVRSLASAYQKNNPLRYGMDKEELRQKTRFPHSMVIFNKVLDQLASYRPIFMRKNQVRADSEQFSLPQELQNEVNQLERMIRTRGLTFYSRKEIEAEWKGKSPLVEILHLLLDDGSIAAVGGTGYIHKDALRLCREKLEELFRSSDAITVADFKETCGLSRKHAIPLLEWMDAVRITVRDQNLRRIGPDFAAWRMDE